MTSGELVARRGGCDRPREEKQWICEGTVGLLGSEDHDGPTGRQAMLKVEGITGFPDMMLSRQAHGGAVELPELAD